MFYINFVTKLKNTTDAFSCIIVYSLPHEENKNSFYIKSNKTAKFQTKCYNFLSFFLSVNF